MISRRFLTTAILSVATLLGASHQAEAGLRVRIDSGATTNWYYGTSNTFLSTGEFVIGAYTGTVETTVTNFPGTTAAGTMGQTVNIQLVGANPAAISAQSWVVDDSTLGGLTPGAITAAGDIA